MCSIIWNIHCRALHSGGCVATECSTLQLEILLSLRRFYKQKKYTCKNMHLPLTGKITKIERSFKWQTMRPSSPRLIKAQCVPFWSRMSLIFHVNITESVYPHFTLSCDSQGFTTGDNSWLNRIGPDQNKQSKCHFFKGINIQISLLDGNTFSLMRNINTTAVGFLIN